MTERGIARGNTIVLERPLPLPDGQPVTVTVEPRKTPERGSPAAVLAAVRRAPHLSDEDVDELQQSILAGRQPASFVGIFDEDGQ